MNQERALKQRIFELERHTARLEAAIDTALASDSLTEIRRLLADALGSGRMRWDKQTIVAKAQEWARMYGEPPSAADWNPSVARYHKQAWRVERYFAGDWPGATVVARHFGSWNQMIAAAGFPMREPGSGGRPGGNPKGQSFDHLPVWDGWEFVHGYRARRGLTQIAVAEKSHLAISYVRAIERGKQTNPSVRVLLALSGVLGVRPGAFFE